jgi:hypothetical protein
MNPVDFAESPPSGEVMSVNSQTEAVRSWAPVVGRWSIEPERVRFLGPQDDGSKPPFGICVTNADLTDGSVSTRVSLSQSSDDASLRTEGKVVLGYRSPGDRYVMAGLGGWHLAYTIGEFDPAFGWRALASKQFLVSRLATGLEGHRVRSPLAFFQDEGGESTIST